jgi:hypothetical protein
LGRRTRRLIFFVLAILAGLAAGLFYGWEVNPVLFKGTSPDSLRVDYKGDIVLMIAELYEAEGDSGEALTRLAFLGDEDPASIVEEAIVFAEEHNYTAEDLVLMRALLTTLDASSEVLY